MIYFFDGGGSAPVVASTWNPSDKDSEITLSSGDLTASHPSGSGFKGVRATQGKSSGLRYFTMTATTTGGSGWLVLGIADANYILSGGYLGQHTSSSYKKSVGIWSNNNVIYFNMTAAAGNNAPSPTYGNGEVIGVLVDFSTFNIKFYKDATATLMGQYTDTGPWSIPMFPAAAIFVGGVVSALNCGGPFTNLPAGAVAWDS